ncbi:MAG: exodeoxyribonuclease VII small subunit [Verrucomicrobiota bacterium]|nr:exodeoxyribonuclease VII small subunit [Verrucomicrobiota bacterium]
MEITSNARATVSSSSQTRLGKGKSGLSIAPGELMFTTRFMSSAAAKKLTPELNFEAAMDRLEEIVGQMESGKMMLDELIVRYEEGMKLVKTCQERLASAEQRIEIITRNHAGKAVVQPFEAAAEPARTASAPQNKESEHDEVRLF